jgi:hypothetical protein
VVRSRLDGRYSLPIAEGDVLFVTKPAGYGLAAGRYFLAIGNLEPRKNGFSI